MFKIICISINNFFFPKAFDFSLWRPLEMFTNLNVNTLYVDHFRTGWVATARGPHAVRQ